MRCPICGSHATTMKFKESDGTETHVTLVLKCALGHTVVLEDIRIIKNDNGVVILPTKQRWNGYNYRSRKKPVVPLYTPRKHKKFFLNQN